MSKQRQIQYQTQAAPVGSIPRVDDAFVAAWNDGGSRVVEPPSALPSIIAAVTLAFVFAPTAETPSTAAWAPQQERAHSVERRDTDAVRAASGSVDALHVVVNSPVDAWNETRSHRELSIHRTALPDSALVWAPPAPAAGADMLAAWQWQENSAPLRAPDIRPPDTADPQWMPPVVADSAVDAWLEIQTHRELTIERTAVADSALVWAPPVQPPGWDAVGAWNFQPSFAPCLAPDIRPPDSADPPYNPPAVVDSPVEAWNPTDEHLRYRIDRTAIPDVALGWAPPILTAYLSVESETVPALQVSSETVPALQVSSEIET